MTMRSEATQLFELPPDRVAVVPNGIDAPRWRAPAKARAAARGQHPGGGPLLVYAGRLVHEKGVQTLLDTIRPLRQAHPDLRLAIAGTGTHEAALHALARKLRIARTIDWLGFVPETRLAALLGAADAVVVPSFYEPFGIVALEAAASGAPLVVAETGGLRDLVAAGIAAASFPAGDADALTTVIGKLLADPATARQTAARAARIVRRSYTWGAVAAQTEAVYARAGQRRRRTGVRSTAVTTASGGP
jgi:glycogen(starch) synthase